MNHSAAMRTRAAKSAPRSRKARVFFAATTATTAIAAALLAHLAAGGQIPGPAGVVVPWVFAVFACTLLSGTRLSVWRIAVGAVLAQVVFHLLFILGAGDWTLVAAPHPHQMMTPAVLSGGMDQHMAMSGALMLTAHGIAAAATVAVAVALESIVERVALSREPIHSA